jgi:hypothetical protein
VFSPVFVTPMAAESVTKLPEGHDWIYELKLDGSPYSVAVSTARNDEGEFQVFKRSLGEARVEIW